MTIFRHRSLLIVSAIAVALIVIVGDAAAAMASRSRGPVHYSRPRITGQPFVGKTLLTWPGRWSGARVLSYRWERCNTAGSHCKVIRTGHAARPATARRYRLTKADVSHRIRVIVLATNAFGATPVTSRVTAVIKKRGAAGGPGQASTPSPNPAPPGTAPNPSLLTLVPSAGNGAAPAGIPRSDAACAAAVTPTGEKRPSNTTANNTVPSDPAAIQWNPAYKAWPAFVSDRNQVTGDFKGTTDEIIQWAACKWGIDVNVVRADAWLESGWYVSTRSGCAGPEASFGLFQIVAEDCNGNLIHGGWPYLRDDTALNADYWGAWIRGCFDGAFLTPGHPWQTSPAQGYGGQSMAQVVAQHGEDYALWGCIGAWFSNAWYSAAAQGYIATVQKDYAATPWLQPGT
jgi:autotransporter family porin